MKKAKKIGLALNKKVVSNFKKGRVTGGYSPRTSEVHNTCGDGCSGPSVGPCSSDCTADCAQ